MLIGAIVGLVAGIFAATVFVTPRGCIVPVELTVDPIIGIVLGAWYGPVVVNAVSKAKAFNLSPVLHTFFDTVFGIVLGYHFAAGLFLFASMQFHVEGLVLGVSLLAACCGGLGGLFYWSTGRWIKRMGHDGDTRSSLGLRHDT